jgi:esterase/lipase
MHTAHHSGKETALAYVKKDGDASKPMIIFCGGFRSDMQGTKAIFLEEYAQKNEYGFIRFDYSGHGKSEGKFEDGTISSWTKDAYTIMSDLSGDRDIILVGSSMGGWISLLLGAQMDKKLVGLIGLAAAPDFSKDMFSQFSAAMKMDLTEKGFTELPNDYSDDPYIITRALIDDGAHQCILHAPIDINCPVILLQSKCDTAVQWEKALKIQDKLTSDRVDVILLKDGDHSLSRPQDLKLLGQSIERLTYACT